jgi:hypothetical protein
VTRRAALPGAAELFRTTARSPVSSSEHTPSESAEPAHPRRSGRTGRGRGRHDAKITVYVSDEELVSWEQARLALRAEHGITVDRGRLIREAMAMVLADLDEHGSDSALVSRLGEHDA